MYIRDGIAYAGEASKLLTVRSVRPLCDYRLNLTFSNGETRVYNFKPMLDYPVFRPLKKVDVFSSVYLDRGTVTWNGEIDIASETLYEGSEPAA